MADALSKDRSLAAAYDKLAYLMMMSDVLTMPGNEFHPPDSVWLTELCQLKTEVR